MRLYGEEKSGKQRRKHMDFTGLWESILTLLVDFIVGTLDALIRELLCGLVGGCPEPQA